MEVDLNTADAPKNKSEWQQDNRSERERDRDRGGAPRSLRFEGRGEVIEQMGVQPWDGKTREEPCR